MTFMELAAGRYSSRCYQDRPVEAGKIDAIVEAGRLAPTAKNLQPVRVIVADDADGLGRIAKTANLYGAPLGIVVVADTDRAWRRPFDGKSFADIDASIVTTQMMYEAQDLGLGTVWIGYFDPAVIRSEFGLAENEEPSAILAVGYRADETSRNHGKRNEREVFSSKVSSA